MLYERHQLTISDPEGSAHIAHRRPAALTALGSTPCHIVRQGVHIKHDVVGQGFPVAISSFNKMRCRAHQCKLDMLHPLVYQDLPASVSIRPELVVLTKDLMLIYEAYENLAVQVSLNPYSPSICMLWISLESAVSELVRFA